MFGKLFLITALATCCLAARMPSGDVARIIGGKDIDIKEAPYQVAITNNRNDWRWCGGVIYSYNIILSSAYCVTRKPALAFTVRVGSTLKNSGGTEIPVDDIKVHEGYVYSEDPGKVSANDIAVLRLSKPLVFSPAVQPIRLTSDTPSSSTTGFVSGWGDTENWNSPSKLQGVDVQILFPKMCAETLHREITKDMLCAYTTGKGFCTFDTGGPLVINHNSSKVQLAGIVSYGSMFCDGPGVYADVAVLRPWIESTVKSLGGSVQSLKTGTTLC